MMADELAKVIDRALEEGLSISFKGNVADHIAAAVAEHLASDAVVERAQEAFLNERTTQAGMRAAIRAAVGDESTARARRG